MPWPKATSPGNGEVDKPLNALLVVWVLQDHGTELSRVEVCGRRCRISLIDLLPWLEIAQGGTGTDASNQQEQKSPGQTHFIAIRRSRRRYARSFDRELTG